MKWFYNMKTGTKLVLGFGLCIAFAVAIVLIAVARMGEMDAVGKTISAGVLKRQGLLNRVNSQVPEVRLWEFRDLLAASNADRSRAEMEINQSTTQVDSLISQYASLARQADDKENIQQLGALWKSYIADEDKQIIADASSQKDGLGLITQRRSTYEKLTGQLQKLTDWNDKRGAVLDKEATEAFVSARGTVLILLGVVVLVGIISCLAVTRYMVRNLNEVGTRVKSLDGICVANLGSAVQALATGDLTAKIETGTKPLELDSKDEFGILAKGINGMITRIQGTVASFEEAQSSLSNLLAQARVSSETINQAASQVSEGNTDLSQRTEEQASSLEETASSMEEMTSTVKQNADNSQLANQLASQAREVAEGGGEVVKDAVAAMNEINEGSKRIAEIISVIDEIAFQTNLLALNAAVEAARVGEQGRGFAVVAAEVRNLAGRSATAAKEIKALVNDSVHKVEEGSKLVNESGSRLDEIVSAVKKVADVIAEISAASIEQSAGIEQVNKAVMQMDQTTQQNASLVEEVSAASLSMSRQASELQELVNRFKIESKFLLSVQQSHSAKQQSHLLAEGTTGRPVSAPRSRPKLTVVEQDGFEEF
ncbi:MAG TPA: methyl-accepting chemotaxis protein [Fimbriimonadaceae bacterium]|nr:methyl-accepting chemotaxis protein [Fimbriimonadaceae bacterium]